MAAVPGHALAAPQAPYDVQELARPFVPFLLVEEVAVGALLVALPAGHHVEQQPAGGVALEGGGHLRGQRRGDEAGPEGDEELQPFGLARQHGSGQPGVLAPRPGGGERALEAQLFGRAADLGQVAEVGRALPVGRSRRACRYAVAAPMTCRLSP